MADNEQSEKIGRNREVDDLKAILSTPEGKRFAWRLLERCGVYQSSFTGNSETFFKEGSRSVGLWLIDEFIEAHPKATGELIINSKQLEKDND
jgi:hypothetical protein